MIEGWFIRGLFTQRGTQKKKKRITIKNKQMRWLSSAFFSSEIMLNMERRWMWNISPPLLNKMKQRWSNFARWSKDEHESNYGEEIIKRNTHRSRQSDCSFWHQKGFQDGNEARWWVERGWTCERFSTGDAEFGSSSIEMGFWCRFLHDFWLGMPALGQEQRVLTYLHGA